MGRRSREALGRGLHGGGGFKGQSGTLMGRAVAGTVKHGKGAPQASEVGQCEGGGCVQGEEADWGMGMCGEMSHQGATVGISFGDIACSDDWPFRFPSGPWTLDTGLMVL